MKRLRVAAIFYDLWKHIAQCATKLNRSFSAPSSSFTLKQMQGFILNQNKAQKILWWEKKGNKINNKMQLKINLKKKKPDTDYVS